MRRCGHCAKLYDPHYWACPECGTPNAEVHLPIDYRDHSQSFAIDNQLAQAPIPEKQD